MSLQIDQVEFKHQHGLCSNVLQISLAKFAA